MVSQYIPCDAVQRSAITYKFLASWDKDNLMVWIVLLYLLHGLSVLVYCLDNLNRIYGIGLQEEDSADIIAA